MNAKSNKNKLINEKTFSTLTTNKWYVIPLTVALFCCSVSYAADTQNTRSHESKYSLSAKEGRQGPRQLGRPGVPSSLCVRSVPHWSTGLAPCSRPAELAGAF